MLTMNVTRRRQVMNQNLKAMGKEMGMRWGGGLCILSTCLCLLFPNADSRHAIMPEYAVSQGVYLVAHHTDFSRTDTKQLDKFKE